MIYLENVSVDVDVLMLLEGEEKNIPSATALTFGQHPQCWRSLNPKQLSGCKGKESLAAGNLLVSRWQLRGLWLASWHV